MLLKPQKKDKRILDRMHNMEHLLKKSAPAFLKKAEEDGARDPEAVAGAVMWKNIKRESVELDEKKASKDWDGNGKVESDEKEWKGVRNNAIKKAVKKEKKAKK